MRKFEKYARYFRQKKKPANRVAAYGLRVLLPFLLSNAGLYTIQIILSAMVHFVKKNLQAALKSG